MDTIEARRPWEVGAMDIIGPVTRSSEGYCYLLVIQDKFTKWLELQTLLKATTTPVIQAQKNKIALRFDTPRVIITDNRAQFTSNIFADTLTEWNTTHIRTPPYSLQCNPVERTNRVIKTMINQFIMGSQRTWAQKINEIAFAYNTSRHESTQFPPAYLNYGRELDAPNSTRAKIEGASTIEASDDIVERVALLQEAHEMTRINLAKAFSKQSHYYNIRRREWTPEIGDIMAKREYPLSSAEAQFSAKLSAKYTGHYTVIDRIGETIVVVQGEDDGINRAHIKDWKLFRKMAPHNINEIKQG